MESPKPARRLTFKDFLLPFLFPTLIGKCMLLYFGLNYSNYPGEGYGYGLAFSVALTLVMAGRFVWKFRNYEDI